MSWIFDCCSDGKRLFDLKTVTKVIILGIVFLFLTFGFTCSEFTDFVMVRKTDVCSSQTESSLMSDHCKKSYIYIYSSRPNKES